MFCNKSQGGGGSRRHDKFLEETKFTHENKNKDKMFFYLLNFFLLTQRGCRQGDPFSPYLFICAGKMGLNNDKDENTIKGIKNELQGVTVIYFHYFA